MSKPICIKFFPGFFLRVGMVVFILFIAWVSVTGCDNHQKRMQEIQEERALLEEYRQVEEERAANKKREQFIDGVIEGVRTVRGD